MKLINIAAILLIAIVIFMAGRCSKRISTEIITQKVEVPGKSGKSDTIYKPKEIFVSKDKIIYKGDTIVTENPVNKELADKFSKLETDYEKAEAYMKSIQMKEYKIPYEDSLIKITNNIKAQGEVISFQQDYFIKPKEIVVKTQLNKLTERVRVLGGMELGSDKDLDNFTAKANLYLQTKKGNLYNVSYTTDKQIFVGYAIKF